jgi:hypothetical protein
MWKLYLLLMHLTLYPRFDMDRIWTPVQAAPQPSNVSGLSFMGEQVLRALQNKWLDRYNSLSTATTAPAHYFLSNRQGNLSVIILSINVCKCSVM